MNPYVVVFDEDHELFRTTSAGKVTAATWTKIDFAHRSIDGQPLFLEIWDNAWGRDTMIGGFVIYPRRGQSIYSTSIVWDWKERTGISRTGIANVEIEFRDLDD